MREQMYCDTHVSQMKTATVRDLRNSFARISAWIEAGESVEVTKHGKPFARISPAEPPKARKVEMPDFLARLKEDYGDWVLPEKDFQEIMDLSRSSSIEDLL